MATADAVDLTNCDREPIHIPGSVQPHGFLLACDEQASLVQQHSVNVSQFLRLDSADLTHRKLETIFGHRAAHSVRNALAGSDDPARPGLIMGLQLDDTDLAFDVAVHQYNGTAIVEFEPVSAGFAASPLELARALVTRLRKVNETNALLNNAAHLIRGLLRYDRVMVYRFDHDCAGQVISEAKGSHLEPYIGLRYPASDIPRQARELYLKNTIRIISDARGERVPIKPALGPCGKPLDLSFSHLRSVSPIHCEYLRNMGVAASMSVSIIVGGHLWGLIACHHYEPRTLSMVERVAAEMFGEFFSLHLEALNHKRILAAATTARRTLDILVKRVAHDADGVGVLQDSSRDFGQLMPCDGIGLWIDGSWTAHGSVPPAECVSELARFLSTRVNGHVWATNELSDHLPAAVAYRAEASGVLAIALSQIPRDYLLFFRKEVVQTVAWSGNPEKTYETGPHGDRLTPRKSFAIWKETVERQALPWTESDRDIAETIRVALLEIVLRHNELLQEERNKAAQRQTTLNQELNHRVKNILALIKSLVSQSVEDTSSVESYIQTLKGRIQALAYAHDQIIRGGGALNDLIESELQPYRETAREITIEGPALALEGRAFSVVALVVHELATNSVKYGALSVREGRIAVRWQLQPRGACEILWQESGGPAVAAPSRRGFGSRLVDRAVSFDLGGESEVDYATSGVKARFVIPAKFTAPIEQPAHHATNESVQLSGPAPLKGLKILLVEDQFVVAMNVESMLLEQGAVAVQLAATVAEALHLIATSAPDVAVLDVNLGEVTSLAVAEELVRRQIPFVFATGYGDSRMVPESMASISFIHKPYDGETIAIALSQVLAPDARDA